MWSIKKIFSSQSNLDEIRDEIEYDTGKYHFPRVKVPTVLQMEAVECGAASLAMILAYYDKWVPLEELRLECGVSRDGVRASNIVKAAKKYGFNARGFKLELDDFKTVRFPVIIHWNFDHFVVLEGFSRGRVYINDPALGLTVVDMKVFDQSFTGVVLMFEPTEEFVKSGKKPSVILSLRNRLKDSTDGLLFLILVGVALVLIGMVIPIYSQLFIDRIILNGERNMFGIIVVAMIITGISQIILTWLQNRYLLRMENKLSLSGSIKFFWHVLRLPVEFFTQRYVGDISARMESNDTVATLLTGKLIGTLLNVLMAFVYLLLMFKYSVILTLVAVFSILFDYLIMRCFTIDRSIVTMKMAESAGKLRSISMSGLQAIETIKGIGAEADFMSKWSGYFAKKSNLSQKLAIQNMYLSSGILLVHAFADVIILLLGALLVIKGHITVGMLFAFQTLYKSFIAPVNNLINMGSTIQEVTGTVLRLDDVLKYPKDDTFSADLQENDFECGTRKLSGYIEFRNVSFGYGRLEEPLIKNFSLVIKPGQRIAIVGSSGSGKSTVLKMLAGLYKPVSGEILFDGQPRNSIKREVLASSLAMVDQEICLLEGTVTENITFWDDTVLEAEVVRAANDALIHDDISKRENGYLHKIGEGGKNFSGGQRQRIEIARALAGNPTILLMDEATAALDPVTEHLVDENIRKRGITCVIVSHRLSTIRDSDEIIVLHEGNIVQRGTHEELKNVDGRYKYLISNENPE